MQCSNFLTIYKYTVFFLEVSMPAVYSWIYLRHSILLIMVYYWKYLISMVFVALHINGSPTIFISQQFVSVGTSNSSLRRVSCGVAQGRIVGTLLFILYMNDIVRSSSILKFLLYADDTSLVQ